jgi:hypothetical protein
MLHELPSEVRRAVISEAARVLKPGGNPGGMQRGDEPAYDAMLQRFPQFYHEPYYHSYLGEDFAAVSRPYGLAHQRSIRAYVESDGSRQKG